MNLKTFKETIKEECIFFIKNGYKIEYYGNSIVNFRKKENNFSFQLSFQIAKYGELYRLNSLVCKKAFINFEYNLISFSNEPEDRMYSIICCPKTELISTSLPYDQTESNLHFKITTKEELVLYLDFIKSFYTNEAIPFFEKYNSIEKVNSELTELLEKKDFQSLISGNEVIERVYVISLLCNNIEMLKFFEEIYIPYMKEQTDHISVNELNNILKIKEEFEKGNISLH